MGKRSTQSSISDNSWILEQSPDSRVFAVDETADIIIKNTAEKKVEELNESLRESK